MALSLDRPAEAPPTDRPTGAALGLRPVLTLGLVVEAALVGGLLLPLGIWRAPDRITASEPLSEMAGQSGAGLVRFLCVLLLWSAAYLAALSASRRALTPAARRALLLLPLLFALTLAPTWPAASKDVYHYLIEGRIVVVHDANPLVVAPDAFPDDPLYWILSSWQSEPSRYGPLWAAVTALPAWAGGESLRAAVLGFKLIGILSFAGACAFVYLGARRLAPASAITAFVLVAWNPLLIFESAANAHNDALMLLFTSAALYAALRRTWTLAFPALAAAVLVKFTSGLLGPVLLLWAWRGARRDPAERRRLALGLGLSLLLVVVAYAPFWEGTTTFRAIRDASANALNSPGWLLREALERTIVSEGGARAIVSPLLAAVFIAAYAAALRLAWRGGASDSPWLAGYVALAAYLLTVSWWFWPWYITWLLLPAALLLSRPAAGVAVVWTLAALAAYVPITFRPYFWGEPPDDRMPFAVALTTFLPALVALTVVAVRGRRPRAADVAAEG